MIIPKKFQIMGRTIEIEFSNSVYNEEDKHGFASYRKNKIVLQSPSKEYVENVAEETFWHEYAHFLVYYAGCAINKDGEYLHQNEEFINILGSLIHQSINTMEY